MADKTTYYIIELQGSPGFCIGVNQASAGQAVVLKSFTGAGTLQDQWIMDPNSGLIVSAANPAVCIDVQGGDVPQSGSPLVLQTTAPHQPTQRWDWTSAPGFIKSVAVPALSISNSACQNKDGNPIDLELAGGCQLWTRQPLSLLQAGGGHRREMAGAGDD